MSKLKSNKLKKQLAVLTAAVSLLTIFACSSSEDEQPLAKQQEVDELNKNIQSLQEEVTSLKKQLSSLRKAVPKKNSKAVKPTTFEATDSHKDDPYQGPKDSDVLVMAFTDYQCKPCRKFYRDTYSELKSNYIDQGKIKYIVRDFPLAKNTQAPKAAMMAHCAGEQGHYWEMHDALFEKPEDLDESKWMNLISTVGSIDENKLHRCVQSERYAKEIEADIIDGQSIGAKGAPGFFIGQKAKDDQFKGVFVRGAQPFAVFKRYIDKYTSRG